MKQQFTLNNKKTWLCTQKTNSEIKRNIFLITGLQQE